MGDGLAKGSCKHGAFLLSEGCSECIKEAKAAREALATVGRPEPEGGNPLIGPQVVLVRYFSETTGELSAREYTYYSVDRLAVGDIVTVPVMDTTGKAKVSAVDVPDVEIAAFRDKVKTIPGGAIVEPTANPLPGGLVEASLLNRKLVMKCKCGRPDSEFMGIYTESLKEKTFRCCLCESGIKENSDEAVNLYGTGRGRKLDNPKSRYHCPPDCCFRHSTGGCSNIDVNPDFSYEDDENLPRCLGYTPLEADRFEVPPGMVVVKVRTDDDLAVQNLFKEGLRLKHYAEALVISDNTDLQGVTNDLSLVAKLKKALTAKKAEYVGPIKAHLDAVNGAFAELLAPFEVADRVTRDKVKAFRDEVVRRTAEAARIEAEKERLAHDEAALNDGEYTVNLGTAQAPPPVPAHNSRYCESYGGC